MKMLIVVHGYPPDATGGTELYAEAHARVLARQHRDAVTVLTRDADPSRNDFTIREERRDGIQIVAINNTYRHVRRFEDSYASDALAAVAAGIIDRVQPDVAHIHHLTHLSTAIVDALAARSVPTFMTLHDYWLICHRGQLFDTTHQVCAGPGDRGCDACIGLAGNVGAIGFAGASMIRSLERALPPAAMSTVRRAAEAVAGTAANDDGNREQSRRRCGHMRAVCDRITHFVAPSVFIRDQFIGFGVSPDRITTAPYGIDHQEFAGASRPRAGGGGPLRIGFFGSLMVSKAPHLIMEAASLLPAGAITIDLFGAIAPYHGDDRYRAVLEPLLSGADVRLHAPVPHQDVARAMQQLDAVVVPSIWPENSPFVIHEALLAGVPVVASRIGGIPELIHHERNGLLFVPGDSADLARQLSRLRNDRRLLESLRAAPSTIRTIEEDIADTRTAYAPTIASVSPQRLAAIILNFQTPEDTLLAVKALLQSDRRIDDLLIVNNGSADAPGTMDPSVARLAGSITILHNGANLGFSGGMNVGIREAMRRGAGRVLLVNSDVIVPPDCVGHLEAALAATPGAGVAGPVILARTDPCAIASLGISYSHASGRIRHQGFASAVADTTVVKARIVDAVSGCVMLIARPVLDAIGNLDDAYFFSFEDVDFCLRAKRAGFSSIIAGDARVYHEGHRSIGQTTPSRLYFAARNHLLLAQRVNGSPLPLGLWAAPIVALNLAHAVRARGGSLPARLAAVVRGTRDYARGRFGAGAESARLAGLTR